MKFEIEFDTVVVICVLIGALGLIAAGIHGCDLDHQTEALRISITHTNQ